MGKVSELWRRVGMLVHRRKFERELEEEMRLHRELKEKDLIAEGRGGARGAVCGEPAIRECAVFAGARERGLGLEMAERFRAGRAVRSADAVAKSGVNYHRGDNAGAGHWREHSSLHALPCRNAQGAARHES